MATKGKIYFVEDSLTAVTGTAGNDYFYNYANEVTLSGGKGNDTIFGESYKSSINGGDGNDAMSLSSSYSGDYTIATFKNRDSIPNAETSLDNLKLQF